MSRGRDVKRCQLWASVSGTALLGTEVDDPKLDQTYQALTSAPTPPPHTLALGCLTAAGVRSWTGARMGTSIPPPQTQSNVGPAHLRLGLVTWDNRGLGTAALACIRNQTFLGQAALPEGGRLRTMHTHAKSRAFSTVFPNRLQRIAATHVLSPCI